LVKLGRAESGRFQCRLSRQRPRLLRVRVAQGAKPLAALISS
jgi:hypothetical protein